MTNDSAVIDHIDKYLRTIYYDTNSPASLYGQTKLWDFVRNRPDKPTDLTFSKLKRWLLIQQVHYMHSQVPKHFPTEHLIFDYINQEWSLDLVYIGYRNENAGNQYILMVMDSFSRFLMTKNLKNKSCQSVTKAFKEILDKGRHPEVIVSDAGGEFKGQAFQDLLKEYSIIHQIAYGATKASLIERCNRTLENRLYKYFYEKQTHNFVTVIDSLVRSYNETTHSFLKMPPADVTESNAFDLYCKVYMPIVVKRGKHPVIPAFKKNDLVRLSRAVNPFSRGYGLKYSEEIFKIASVIRSHPPRYRVTDLNKQLILGSYYEPELRKIPNQDIDQISFKIDKILRKKKIGKKNYSYISWLGYGPSFRTWIPSSQVEGYKSKI